MSLADLGGFDIEEGAEFMELIGDMADADGAVVCGALRVPIGDKAAWANLEAISAVGVANFKDGAGDGFGLGDEEFQSAIDGLDD